MKIIADDVGTPFINGIINLIAAHLLLALLILGVGIILLYVTVAVLHKLFKKKKDNYIELP